MITEEIFKNTIICHNLISKGDKIIVALSGGADSCCLLYLLSSLIDEYDISICAAHINHNLRAEAIEDQRFVQQLCAQMNIPCYVKSADVKAFAAANKISEEDAGRQIRYAFFDELAERIGADKIATAHNRNDNAETIIMNFMRGSAVSGLCGIPYSRGKRIIRPILDLTRSQIEEYCVRGNIAYVTDKTNLEPVYTRNKIRLDLIPYIENNFNSAFVSRISANSSIISAENDYIQSQSDIAYSETVRKTDSGYAVDLAAFTILHTALKRRVLLKILQNISDSPANASGKYVDAVLTLADTACTGKSVDLPNNTIAAVSYDNLYIEKKTENDISDFCLPLTFGKNIANGFCFDVLRCESAKKSDAEAVYIRTDVDGLYVRNRRNGDFFYPVGMAGKKKLKDFFIDLKIPSQLRNKIPILTTGYDKIIWVVGKRADRRFLADLGSECIKITFTEKKG